MVKAHVERNRFAAEYTEWLANSKSLLLTYAWVYRMRRNTAANKSNTLAFRLRVRR